MENCSESYFKTAISSNNFNFNWAIENFKNLPSGKKLRHPNFSLSSNQVFYAEVEKSENILFFAIIFQKGSDVDVTLTLYVSDGVGEVLCEETKNCVFGRKEQKECLINAYSDYFENASVLNLKCIMNCFEAKSEPEVSRFQPQPLSDLESLSALSSHLKAIYDTHLKTDITLKVDGKTLTAHKSILCARSPVFTRMFETPMAESEKNTIEITDLEFPVLEHLVEFIYTGVLAKDDFEYAYALYYAADKYDVSTLRRKCIDLLLSSMTIEKACSVLELADQHSDVVLEKFVMDYIKFHFKCVQQTDAWSELEPGLLDKVMDLCSGDKPK